jgi:hypothetical protein
MFEVLQTGDLIKFTPTPPLVVPSITAPVPLIGTGSMTNITMVCCQGDELPPFLRAPQPYTSGGFTIPGMGLITVTLLPVHLSTCMTVGGRKPLLKGTPFQGTFQVTVPAQMPVGVGTVPDPVVSVPLMVEFISVVVWNKAI